jgi:hypothetical protein
MLFKKIVINTSNKIVLNTQDNFLVFTTFAEHF